MRPGLRAALPRTIAAFAQAATDPADRTIFVRSAGNTWGQCDQSVGNCDRDQDGNLVNNDAPYRATSPSLTAGLPAYISELRGHFVTAVAVNTNGSGIASFSNRCGIAADWCLAAPGSGSGIGRLLAVSGGCQRPHRQQHPHHQLTPFGGTSAAAPYVSGALALLIDYFNGRLGNTEVVERMLADRQQDRHLRQPQRLRPGPAGSQGRHRTLWQRPHSHRPDPQRPRRPAGRQPHLYQPGLWRRLAARPVRPDAHEF